MTYTWNAFNLSSSDNIFDGGAATSTTVGEVMDWLSQFPRDHNATYDGSDLVVIKVEA